MARDEAARSGAAPGEPTDDEAVRDETARDERLPVTRRSLLGAAGTGVAAAVGGVGLAGAGDSASAAGYRTVTVPAGETRTFSVGSGETLENLLIDITASGATYRISATGSDWAIRNVGVRGRYQSGTDASVEPIVVYGDGVIENVYLGDGGDGSTTGIFVHAKHSGDIRMDRVNVQNWPDNGIYASSPGNGSEHSTTGGGGTVRITNSFSKGNGTSNFRLGTTGSYLENCVSVDGVHRGYWGYYEDTKLVDCDVTGAPIVAGEDYWEKGHHATVSLENCRYDVRTYTATSTNSVTGTSVGTPRTDPPAGVPRDPVEAASGASSADDGSTSDPTTGGDSGSEGTVLELVSGRNVSNVAYEFTVAGSVRKRTSAGDVKAESNDTVTDVGQDTVTVSGVAGNGYGDSYLVDGDVVEMDLDESKWTLRYGGEEVSVADLVLPNKVVVDGTDSPRRASSYEIEFSGTVRKSAALGSVNARDTVSDGAVSGRVIGGKDGYRFSGEITAIRLDGPATVRVEDGP